MRKLSGVTKSDVPVGKEDAYADLAPDPITPANDASRERNWLAEFPDESQVPAEKSSHWRALGESLEDENR